MYVDEVGNSDLNASDDPNHRYLSLTGVIIELEHVAQTLHPELETLKVRFFGSHPDEPIILHRKDILNKKYPFHSLKDPPKEAEFNQEILLILRETDYVVLTAVIDKLRHRERYKIWRYDPYHYCMAVLAERYVLWLHRYGVKGDVMAESRGGKEDRRLKDSFDHIFINGTDYLDADRFRLHLTSRRLKVKPKSQNIAGLQLADLLAHPSFRSTLARHERRELPENFGGLISAILEESKYDRSTDGRIEGYGRKVLP